MSSETQASSPAATDTATPRAPAAPNAGAATSGTAMGEQAVLPATPETVANLRKASEPRARMLPRLGIFSDMQDRGLFVLFVASGFFLIFGVKTGLWYFGFEGDYSILIACGAAALMFLYGGLALTISAVRLRSDRLGDNFYYMGFVFTLASMSAALVQLQGGREVDSLIGSFGIALFSTILGIAGRVVFTQMRTEVEDIEERVRQDLLNAADTLRGQLGAATRDLESFRLGVQQAIHERLTESVDTFSQMAEAQVQRIRETVDGTIVSVQSAFAAHERAADSLSALGDKVTASVDRLVTRIEEIHIPPSLLEAKMDALVGKLSETADAFERVANADQERHKDLAAASAELRRVVTQIGNQLSKLQSTAEALQSAGDPASGMADALARAKAALDATTEAAKGLGESSVEARQASRELTEALKAYGAMVVSVANAQQTAAASAAADVETARQRIAKDLEESREAAAEVQKVLAETARVVTQAINSPPSTTR